MAFFLECIGGHLQGKRVPIRPGKAVTFGRDKTNTVIIQDRKLSRIHCQIEIVNDAVVLTDLNSTNGTFVNHKRVDETAINLGDVIGLGRVEFQLIEAAEDTDKPAEQAERPRCVECGGDVSEEELASGAARRVANRAYCANCVAKFSGRDRQPEPTPETVREEEQEREQEKAAVALEPGAEFAGTRVLQKLSDGHLGPVYLAEQVATGRQVLLKMLAAGDQAWARRYLSAVYASGQLIHNNIVLIYDTGEVEGRFYVCQEFVDGETLSAILSKRERLPAAEALAIVSQIGHALRHAREYGVSHGAVAPCNVFVATNGVAKLANFGLSSFRAPNHPPVSQDLAILPYLPPELLNDEKPAVDFASDCYSVGAVFFHLIAGRPPFRGSTIEKLRDRIQQKPAPPVSSFVQGLPPAADQIVQRCLEKLPGARYQQPKEFLYDLEEVLRREL
jgi:hypothetical protein